MKTFGKIVGAGAIFLAGYAVGFFEMKYKVMKVILEGTIQKEKEKDEKSKEEAQA